MPDYKMPPPGGRRMDGSATSPGRVMIVDDSSVIRRSLSQWIDSEPDLQVVACHWDGRRAVDDVRISKPHVILLDIAMPGMNGLDALPLLRRARPSAKILMVSTLTKRNADISLRALHLGAADFVPKPELNTSAVALSDFKSELLTKVKGLVARRARKVGQNRPTRLVQPPARRDFSVVPPRVIVIGSSTGGPEALNRLLERLAPSLTQTPVLIAQHMPPIFTDALAKRLAGATRLEAAEATHGEALKGGCIYVAPGGRHMTIANSAHPRIEVREGPAVNFCRPSVDLLFASVAKVFGRSALGIVLTGMGADGAVGAREIADAGGSIIAQDEATSIVWGMPGSAVRAGACAAVLPLDEIAYVTAQRILEARAGGGI
ncbi:MAG: chemotaxis response regulator protein-glutamate methylesterase [Pseudomonadota bacterium]